VGVEVSTAEPWVLAVDAAETPVEDRARFEAEAEAMLEFHAGWALLATCHRVEVYETPDRIVSIPEMRT